MDYSLPGPSSPSETTTKSLEILSTRGDTNSASTGWTDEKHSLYLNSIEASFVNQLYNREHLSKDSLGWLSRIQKHTSSSGSSASSLLSGQFKVQKRGCWGKLKFERLKKCVDIEDQSRLLSENPWIQHFRSPSIGKGSDIPNSKKDSGLHVSSSNKVVNSDFSIDSLRLTSLPHGIQATSSKLLPACYHLYRQDSVGSNTEVSDQNFVDAEFETIEPNKECRKRRVRTVSPSPIKDQVVPSGKLLVKPKSDENDSFPREQVGESSSRKTEDAAGVPDLENEPMARNES